MKKFLDWFWGFCEALGIIAFLLAVLWFMGKVK